MGQTETHDPNIYYVPHGSRWPIIATLALFTTMIGAALTVNKSAGGHYVLYAGIAALVFMLFGWFGDVIRESVTGFYNRQVDISFRMGMIWFIFSEVMFFAAFFGALFYARMFSVPWLGGEGDGALTHEFIWNGYSAAWPTNGPAKIGGTFETIGAWGLPFLNTLILLTSGITVTIAHHALRAGERRKLLVFLGATVALGVLFLYYQATEYYHAYHELGLTLGSGIYGSTFFMLTGFHGMHVTLGTIMLLVILLRSMSGHFTAERHFAFEGVAWYWHFVDVVWLLLFVFVYWL